MPEKNSLNTGLWDGGWYRFAHRVPSPNFGPRPTKAHIDLIVLHSISLPPGVYGGNQVQGLFTNQLDWEQHPYFKQIEAMEVSAHFYIQRGGEVWQFVSCDDRAWHAGASNYRGRGNCNNDSIGIELEGLEGDTLHPGARETPALAWIGRFCSKPWDLLLSVFPQAFKKILNPQSLLSATPKVQRPHFSNARRGYPAVIKPPPHAVFPGKCF
jgi:AmpD protein